MFAPVLYSIKHEDTQVEGIKGISNLELSKAGPVCARGVWGIYCIGGEKYI